MREHAASCPDCAAAAAVAPWMERFAGLSDREHILPHPSIAWLKAQVMRNSAEIARASRPMHLVQMPMFAARLLLGTVTVTLAMHTILAEE